MSMKTDASKYMAATTVASSAFSWFQQKTSSCQSCKTSLVCNAGGW
jgi:hypothetical protein